MPRDVKTKKKGSLKRLDPYGLTEVIETVRQCLDEEKEVPLKFTDNVWDDAMNLEPVLNFVAHSAFVPPQSFNEAMDTFLSLLAKGDNEVTLPMLQDLHAMMQEPGTQEVIRYLDWLTPAMDKVATTSGNAEWSPSKQPARQPQQVRNALNLWPGECAKLRECAGALFEALCEQGSKTVEQVAHWKRCVDLTKVIQAQQEDECCRIAEDLDRTSQKVCRDIRNDCEDHDEWPKISKTTENALLTVKRLSTEKLADRQTKTASATEEYESLNQEQKRCAAAVTESREQASRQVRRLQQADKIFTHVAGQLIGWTRDLPQKLRDLNSKHKALEELLKIEEQIMEMEPELEEAVDERDDFMAELNRLRNEASVEEKGRGRRSLTGGLVDNREQATQVKKRLGQVQEHERATSQRVTLLENKLNEAHEARLKALAALPFQLADASPQEQLQGLLNPKGTHKHHRNGLDAKLQAVESVHKNMVVPIETNDKNLVLDKVAAARKQAAEKLGVDPAFVCPITLDIMSEPVIASDGHCYDRKAFKEWVRRSAVPCSPLAGTVLKSRSSFDNLDLVSLMQNMGIARNTEKNTEKRRSQEAEKRRSQETEMRTSSDGQAAEGKKKKRGSKETGTAATAIQRAVRKSLMAKQEVSQAREAAAIREGAAATRIQSKYRGNKARSSIKEVMAKKAKAAAAVVQDPRAASPQSKVAAKAAPQKPAAEKESSSEYYSESEYESGSEA